MGVRMNQFASLVSFLMFALLYYAIIRIVQRAGYHWAWALLMFIPVLNFVIVCFFAFRTWPIEKFTWWQSIMIKDYENIIEQHQNEVKRIKN